MTDTLMNKGGEDPLEEARAFVAKWMTHFGTIQQVLTGFFAGRATTRWRPRISV